jgi:hypothetical protein
MKKSILFSLLALAFVACEKEEEQPTANPSTPQALQPSVGSNPDAILVALNISSTQDVPFIGPTTIVAGSAVASFPNASGAGQNVGSVSCDGTNLSFSNGSYFFQPSATDPTGLDFGSSVPWTVAGGSGVAAFNATYNRSVPRIGLITGATSSTTRGNGLSLSVNSSDANTNISNADSLMFVVYDKNGKYLRKTQAKAQTTVAFNAAELNTLAAGAGYVQVNAYNFEVRTISGLEVAFINQGSNTVATEWK